MYQIHFKKIQFRLVVELLHWLADLIQENHQALFVSVAKYRLEVCIYLFLICCILLSDVVCLDKHGG